MNFSNAVNPACVAGEGLGSNSSNTWQCLLVSRKIVAEICAALNPTPYR